MWSGVIKRIMKLMQPTVLKGRSDRESEPAISSPKAGYALNVAVVYQDALTRQWAGQVRDLMAGVVGQDAIRGTECKISDLVESRAYWEGVAALAHADVIVVSLNAADRLPGGFYLWVNMWLQERSGRPGVLVALLNAPEDANSGAIETQRYLSAVARQGQLQFLINERSRQGETTLEVEEDKQSKRHMRVVASSARHIRNQEPLHKGNRGFAELDQPIAPIRRIGVRQVVGHCRRRSGRAIYSST